MFSDVCANSELKEKLTALIRGNRLPHSVIIEGENGMGGDALAKGIAEIMLGEENTDLIERDIHPDVISYHKDKARAFSVEQVRKILNEAVVMPNQSESKIIIIYDAELMNASAQNAFLKMLEEPPKAIYFLLLCASKSAMLETVLSRCTVFSLTAPSTQEAIEALKSTGEPQEKIETALSIASGNVGKAREILSSSTLSDVLSSVDEYFTSLTVGNTYKMLTVTAKYKGAKERTQAELFCTLLHDKIYRSLKSKMDLTLETRFSVKDLFTMCERLSAAESELKLNPNLPLFFTCLAADLNSKAN